MANSMYFDYKVKRPDGTVISSGGHHHPDYKYKASSNACWGSIAQYCGLLNEHNELVEINWFVEMHKDNGSHFSSLEEIVRAFEHFFPKEDKYQLKWEVTGRVLQEPEDGDWQWPEIRIYDFADYPRQLMIAKLFTIRNMSRYDNRIWRALLDAGVPYGVAATVGAMFHVNGGFAGKVLSSEAYANILCLNQYNNGFLLPTVADVRNFANCTRYLGVVGAPWSEKNGYQRTNQVMNSVCRPKNVTTNSPTLFSLGIKYGGIKYELLEDLIFRLTGRKFDLSDIINKV